MIYKTIIIILLSVDYFAAECVCQNEVHCDGASFSKGNPRKCTAYRHALAINQTVVRFI